MDLTDEQATRAREPNPSRRRLRSAIIVVAVALFVFYLIRMLWLGAFVTEGARPDASAIPLPPGAEIVSSESQCASGGYWNIVRVRPPSGVTAAEMAEQIGATPTLAVGPNLFDPRTATDTGRFLELRLDYYSGPQTP